MIDRVTLWYRQMLVRWMQVVHHRARMVLFLALVATVGLAAYTADTLGINTRTTDMLSPKLGFRQNAEAIKAAFPQYSNVILIVLEGTDPDRVDAAAKILTRRLQERADLFRNVFYPPADPYFEKTGLLYLDVEQLDELALRLAENQPFLGTLAGNPTLDGLFEILGLAIEDVLEKKPEDAKGLSRMFDEITGVVEAMAEGRPRGLSWKQMMDGESAAAPERQLIVAQPLLDYSTLAPAKTAIGAIREIAASLNPENDLRLRLTGPAALDQAELQSIQEGMGLIGLVSVTLVTGFLLIGLRSARLVLAALLTLVMGLAWSLAFAAFAVGHLNLISVAFAVLFVGLSVDFGIHFSLRFREALEKGMNTAAALEWATEGVGGALTFCAVAAAIGFYAFLPTDYRGVAELGMIAGTSMFIALFANLSVLPAFLACFPPRKATPPPILPFDFPANVRQNARKIVAVSGVLAAIGLAALPYARFDFDPLDLQNPDSEAMQTFGDLLADGAIDPYAVTILADNLEAATQLKKRLSALPEVDGVVIPQDLVPADQDEKLPTLEGLSTMLLPVLMMGEGTPRPSDDDRQESLSDFQANVERLAADEAAFDHVRAAARLAGALRRLETAFPKGPPLDALEDRLLGTLPGQLASLRVALTAERVTFSSLPESLLARFVAEDGRARVEVRPAEDPKDPEQLRRFTAAVQAVAPNATGDSIMMIGAVEVVVGAFWQATVLALVLITLLLVFVLQRVSDVLLVLAPLGLAALLTNLLGVLFDIPFNFANIIVLPLILGLGVANGIHFVLRERKGASNNVLRTSTPRAIVFSALTTIGSFASLTLSTHLGTASMGMLLTVALVLVMICTLTLIPALMTIRRKET
ncbi:MAG: MMPL family transporter [Alphaproteobacteria bacterium]|nr:MMPL family transporter [Alphaproteobacteria bacterium]